MNPDAVYRQALFFVAEDSVVTLEERAMLDRLRVAADLPWARARGLERMVLAQGGRPARLEPEPDLEENLVFLISALVTATGALSATERGVIERFGRAAGVADAFVGELIRRGKADAAAGRRTTDGSVGSPPAGAASPLTKELARIVFTDMVVAMVADGRVDPRELTVLEDYRRRLGLSIAEAEAIFGGVARREIVEVVFPEGRLERKLLYRSVKALVVADGVVTPAERQLLARLARLAGLPEGA
ncbi:MAG: TerB family tellurite resistance protein [Planctomycetes bacterium]|nr:TerB family tellurite resistance protein [Planctomycetota bacterium]